MQKAYSRIYWKNHPSTDSPINENNLNRMDGALDTIDNEVIALDAEKLGKVEAAGMVTGVSMNRTNGVITITYYDGSEHQIDTMLEKLAVNFDFDPQTQRLIIILDDGTQKFVDLSALITQFEFLSSDTIDFQVQPDGKVTAIVREGSIQEKHLRPNYLADIKVEVAKAEGSAANAAKSETEAAKSATSAANSAAAAAASEENAEIHENNAANSATAAAASATDATVAANAAAKSETEAKKSEIAAANSAQGIKEAEENASASALSAASSASAALESQNAAAESAQSAATSETNAAQSEAAAASSAADAQKSAEDAEQSAQAADKSATDALESQNAAAESAQDASTSATNAAESETSAALSATAAADSAAAAAASEESVAANAEAAERNALLAKSWAVDGTGIREGEETDNAKYYCQQAHGFRDESEQFSQSAENAVEQINKKLQIGEFHINNKGQLVYTNNTPYVFKIDSGGRLRWGIKTA